MNTSLVVALPLSALVFAAGCSMPAAPCPRAPDAEARVTKDSVRFGGSSRVHTPISIDYKLTRADTVLISGQSDFDGAGSTNIDQQSPHETSERLRVNARSEGEKIIVSVDYTERTNEGHEIAWSPTISLIAGATARVKLDLVGGETRTIIISARPSEKLDAKETHPVASLSP